MLWRRSHCFLDGLLEDCIGPPRVKVRELYVLVLFLLIFWVSVADTHFDAEVFVAGFASRLNNPDVMSRSQRAFLRLAKGAHSPTYACDTSVS